MSPALTGRFFITSATWEAQLEIQLTANQTRSLYCGANGFMGDRQQGEKKQIKEFQTVIYALEMIKKKKKSDVK